MGDAEGCGEDVSDGVEDECDEGLGYWTLYFSAQQYIKETEENTLTRCANNQKLIVLLFYCKLL